MKYCCLGVGVAGLLLTVIAGCGIVKSLGKNPRGEAIARFDTLPGYKNGSFQNSVNRPDSTIRHNRLAHMFRDHLRPIRPAHALPWVETNLKTLIATVPQCR